MKRAAIAFGLAVLLKLLSGSAAAQDDHDHEHKPSPMDDPAVQRVEPFQVFDNLYYVGAQWVAAWVLETDEGLVLIDTLYGDLLPFIEEGMQSLGLDPAQIKYVVVTHAHFDHAGGAKYFQDKYGARVAMMEADWQLAAGKPDFRDYPRPKPDLVLKDGDTLPLGDGIRFYHTPGHTWGVTSMQFDVRDQGQTYRAFVMGGAGLNFEGKERIQTYINSLRRIQTLDGIQVNIPNHASSGEVFARAKALQNRKTGEPHPFVDPQALQAWIASLIDNASKVLEKQ